MVEALLKQRYELACSVVSQAWTPVGTTNAGSVVFGVVNLAHAARSSSAWDDDEPTTRWLRVVIGLSLKLFQKGVAVLRSWVSIGGMWSSLAV